MSTYGSVTGVAALATTYTNGGVFYDAPSPLVTNPPLGTVEDWLDSVCNYMNLALKESWFVTPVDMGISPDSFGAISEYVNSLTADLVAARNNQGRFFTDAAQNTTLTRWAQIQKDLREWVAQNADGLVADGVLQIERPSLKNQVGMIVIGNH